MSDMSFRDFLKHNTAWFGR